MRKALRDISFIVLAIFYVVSTMGYAVHECSNDGSAQLQIMCGEAPCEHECDSHHNHHDDNCCSTDIYVLTQDQDVTDVTTVIAPLYTLICQLENVGNDSFLENNSAPNVSFNEFLLSAIKNNLQAEFCTFVL